MDEIKGRGKDFNFAAGRDQRMHSHAAYIIFRGHRVAAEELEWRKWLYEAQSQGSCIEHLLGT